MERPRAIFLPGIVTPARDAYRELLAELGGEVDAFAKDLEVYASSTPPPDYSLDLEVAGVLDVAQARGWDRFHVAGYSGVPDGADAAALASELAGKLPR